MKFYRVKWNSDTFGDFDREKFYTTAEAASEQFKRVYMEMCAEFGEEPENLNGIILNDWTRWEHGYMESGYSTEAFVQFDELYFDK